MKFILKSVFILVLLAPISGFSQAQGDGPLSLRERVNVAFDLEKQGARFAIPNSLHSAFVLRDYWFGKGNLEFDRDLLFRRFATVVVWRSITQSEGADVFAVLKQQSVLGNDPDLNQFMVQYLVERITRVGNLQIVVQKENVLLGDIPNILELFYVEAEEAVREATEKADQDIQNGKWYNGHDPFARQVLISNLVANKAVSQHLDVSIAAEIQRRGIGQAAAPTPADYKASVEAVQAAGDAVLAAQAEGSLIAYQLDADMLDGVSEIVAAKLMEGHGVRRAISAKDADVVRQKIHEVLQLEFQQKGIVIEPEVVTAAIQALPELTLTWTNARALVRGICETGLKRVR